MSDYTKATNFTAKDNLITGNPSKLIKGSEIDAELNAIAAAIASKANISYVDAEVLLLEALIESTAFNSNLPGQTGNSGKVVSTDGSTASWVAISTLLADLNDAVVGKLMLKDTGYVYLDKGNSSTTAQTVDYAAAQHQKITATGNFTWSITNWPPTGNLGCLLIELTNGAAFTITWPTINWIKADGTTTTTFSGNGVTLQSSGTDFIYLWTRDGGTTIYGKVVR